ncbi:MAG: DUF4163 domain-containing protein [Oscillospiraceae bacterium]|nr:DUF4163 domain-containing protein [Oscillospiraceae bacterium]MDD6084690.1 DUF4163 domain-containing protein [Oscillospiraceae bacterium]MDY3257909.1 DUF4163 domain-containing protein [Ruminococcus callidus]
MKRKYLKLTALAFALSFAMLSACGNKDEDKKDVEINTIDSNEAMSTTEEAGFDGSYQISLLKKDCWIDKTSAITYYFSEDMNFTEKDKDGEEKKGTYDVTGSDGYPILELKYDDNTKTSYIMLFNSEKSLTLTNSETNKEYQLINKKEKEETSKNDSSSYSVNFETMSQTDISYPVISGWKQEDAQEKYNEEFKNDVQGIIDDAESSENVSLDFEIEYMDDNTLSIVGKGDVYSMGAAHPYSVILCYNIDMQSGEEISLADKIDINSASENFFNKKGCESVSDEITLDDIIDVSMFESVEDVSSYMTETKYFYLDSNGKICVYFEVPYVLGGYAAVRFD